MPNSDQLYGVARLLMFDSAVIEKQQVKGVYVPQLWSLDRKTGLSRTFTLVRVT
jgi:hypothetical protein